MTVTNSPALSTILQTLHQLSNQLNASHDPPTRIELLKQIRLLLGDADKIVGSEMGDE